MNINAFLFVLIFFSGNCAAGIWLAEANIVEVEARDGTWVSVILENTGGTCASNRVEFRDTKWINQNGVNHYYSMVLTAVSTNKPVTIHVKIENLTACYGRIGLL